MKNGNGNFVIVITETGIVVEHLVGLTPWDVTKAVLAPYNSSLIEVVTLPDREGWPSICGLISEEGKLEGLYRNEIATRFCYKSFRFSSQEWPDYIAGPMVICSNDSGLSGLPLTQECLCVALQTLGDFYHATKDVKPSTSESV